MQQLPTVGHAALERADTAHYVEQLRSADLSIGTYTIPTGAVDGQQPHTEDEVYLVNAGRATFVTPEQSVRVGAGSVLFVPAGEPHRFTDITEQLVATVVFGPAEGSRAHS
jgi:mannose-6-phosphate isomerase-like protein (cupin superfamily)